MSVLSILLDGEVMHPMVLLPLAAVATLVVYTLFWAIYNLFFHPLSKFPGPRLWAISTIPYIRKLAGGECHFTILEMHKKYGPIVRVGPNELSLNHPEGMKALRGHRKSGTGENSKEPISTSMSADNIIGADRENHQRYRRSLAHGFSQQSMTAQQPIIRGYVDKLIKGLHAVSDNGTKPVDIAAWYNFTTFDVIGDLAFGEPFGCLDTGKLHPWITLMFSGVKEVSFTTAMARTPWLNNLWKLVTPKQSMNQWAAHVETSREKVRKRLASEKKRPDFIEAMLERTGAAGNQMTFDELASNAQVLILAGSETTATVLTATTYFLASNPETLNKVVNEVRSGFNSESEIDMHSVNKLTYMLACLNEGMRMFPPVINGTLRQIRPEGDDIIGHYIPGGAIVDVWQWAVHNSPDHFALADQYVPERWLEDNDPRFANDAKQSVNPFSLGPRDCIGKNLAYAEMRMILARVLWNFDVSMHPDTPGWDKRIKSYIIWERGAMNVMLTPRDTE
ncbi:hypothetical protein HYE68_003941 [Fusarium pseudograminearum]|nr:hypothetical protein HYE68_003941 [Fusarium pseudograminearum]